MNREPKGYDGVAPYRTFFKWRLCSCCGLEFRRENGWMIDPGFGIWSFPHYLCENCAPNRSAAVLIADLKPWIPRMPKCAPAAPPKAPL